MKNQFVTYEIAKRLKELGFNELCFGWYYLPEGKLMGLGSTEALTLNNKGSKKHFCSAPLWQQAIAWLLKTHQIRFKIEPTYGNKVEVFIYEIISWKYVGIFNSDEQAREAAIIKALELIKTI